MVKRFTVSERAIHWLMALAFFSLLISGLVVGRRGTFHDVMYVWHLASAGVLVGGVALIAERAGYAANQSRQPSGENPLIAYRNAGGGREI